MAYQPYDPQDTCECVLGEVVVGVVGEGRGRHVWGGMGQMVVCTREDNLA